MKHLVIKTFILILGLSMLGTGVTAKAKEKENPTAGVSTLMSIYLDTDTARLSDREYNIISRASLKPEKPENPAEDFGYKKLGIADVDNSLNIRKSPAKDSEIVGELPKNGGCDILKEKGSWYKIKSGKVTGWVKKEYLLTGDAARNKAVKTAKKVAIVDTETLFVREKPSTNSECLSMVPQKEELRVIATNKDNWLKVRANGDKGWISRDYVKIKKQLPKASTISALERGEGSSDSSTGSSVVDYALQFVGRPYVWGGTSLTNGADCSGFTMSVYAKFGVSLPHYSVAQADYGTRVSTSEAKPGDLFFYSDGSRINHVAIYMGGGQIVHASSPSTGIKVSSAYSRTPVCVVRLLND